MAFLCAGLFSAWACPWLERTVRARPREERVWSEIMLLLAERQNPAWVAHP